MTTPDAVQEFIGRTAVDSEGSKVGTIGQVYLDDQSGQPLWVTVSTGMFGTRQSFAPVYGSALDGDQVMLAVTKDQIKDAPNIDDDTHISESEQDALYQHYSGYLGDGHTRYAETGYAGDGTAEGSASGEAGYADRDAAGAQGRDTSGPVTDDAMTRSEERLRVGTEQVEAGRVRLRKHVVTEQVTQTVPVSHEEVRLEREPITEANRGEALSGADISEEENEVTLHAERPVVQKETVPVERVRLGTETVTEDHEVSETIRKEQIDDPDTSLRGQEH
jgi:uncharacterized protein (TIGR02271 family)